MRIIIGSCYKKTKLRLVITPSSYLRWLLFAAQITIRFWSLIFISATFYTHFIPTFLASGISGRQTVTILTGCIWIFFADRNYS